MPSLAPAYCHPAAYITFKRELQGIDQPMGLMRAATAIALHEDPTVSIDAVADYVERLSSAVRARLRSDNQEAAVAHLHDLLFDVIGFTGVEQVCYGEPGSSYIPTALKTKRGLPITMVLIYRTVAAGVGLRVDGINAPGHFLAALHCRESTGCRVQYVDPYHDGALLNRDEAILRCESAISRQLAPGFDPFKIASPKQFLRRILMNLQSAFLRRQQEREALAMQELEALLEGI